jgi:hypothetical protein
MKDIPPRSGDNLWRLGLAILDGSQPLLKRLDSMPEELDLSFVGQPTLGGAAQSR